MPVTLPSTPLATQADLDALTKRVAALEHVVPPVSVPSKTGTYITHTTDPPIIDDGLGQWSLVAATDPALGLQIAVLGAMAPPPPVLDGVTRNVTRLGIDLVGGFRRIVQQNSSGNWYSTTAPAASWTQISGPDGPPVSGIYKASGGFFVDPAGKRFRPKGVNVCYRRLWGDNQVDLQRVSLAALKRAYPQGLNYVRFACHGENPLPPPTDPVVLQWITDLTGAGIVVLVDLHYTGDAVSPTDQRSNTWLASYASAFINNNRVWYDLQNEPHGAGSQISSMMLGQYNAIRGTGNPHPILCCTGNPGGEVQGMNPADFAQMTNVGFDPHCYGWMTSQWPQLLSDLAKFTSRDGVMPTVCSEFGDGGGSDAQDGNWVQNVQTALAHPGGYAAWMVNWMMSPADCLWAPPLDGSAINAGFGQMVHDAIVAAS